MAVYEFPADIKAQRIDVNKKITTVNSNYTVQNSDSNAVVVTNSTSALTVTLPANVPIGFQLEIANINTGMVTVATASGENLISVHNNFTLDYTNKGRLIKLLTSTWLLEKTIESDFFSNLQYQKTYIAPNAFKLSNTTPVVLLPALDNVFYDFIKANLIYIHNTTAYVVSGNQFIRQGTRQIINFSNALSTRTENSIVLGNFVNAAAASYGVGSINFFSNTANPSAGNGDIFVELFYKKRTFAEF